MKTIKQNTQNELIIKNSRFITHLYKINNKEEINNILDNIKKTYKDATHYCYAYIIDDTIKQSDDGEPGGTAGIPILQVLQKNNLNNILAIVVRYFGGIKLGTGGLVRAYTKSITESLTKVEKQSLIKGYNIDIEFDYNNIKEIDYTLKNITITKKEYNNKIIYNINITEEKYKELLLNKNITIKNKIDKYIEI